MGQLGPQVESQLLGASQDLNPAQRADENHADYFLPGHFSLYNIY